MDPNSKLIARKMFKLQVHEAKGTAFQRLFERVMSYRHPSFTPIKPYGIVGDRSNDGYIRGQGRYFQVFAPEDPTSKETASTAAKKAADDFDGLKEYWSEIDPIKDYRFVFNDEYRGSPPPLEQVLAHIRKEHGVEAAVFLAKDLETEALALADDQLIDVIGVPIPELGPLESVDFSVLREVITHILEQFTPDRSESLLEAPDFDRKIDFNGLSTPVAALLKVASYQSEAVKDYFAKNSRFARQQLRDHLSSLYIASRDRFVSLGYQLSEVGDLVFFDLLRSLMPCSQSSTVQHKEELRDAALVVMAYYFEACDIFEVYDAAS